MADSWAGRLLQRRAVLSGLLPLAAIVGAGVFAYFAHLHDSFSWDEPAATWVRELDAPGLGGFMEAVSWPGDYTVATVSYVLLLLLALRWGGWPWAVYVAAAGILDISNEGAKALVGRPRPNPLEPGEAGSFPSGHTVHAVLYLGVVWSLLAPRLPERRQRQALAALFVVTVLLTGLSRIYLGRHWPSDVLGGLLVGSVALWALWTVASRTILAGRLRPSTGGGDAAAGRAGSESV